MKPDETEKESRLSVRVDPALKARLAAASKNTGIDEPTIVRQCLTAFCDHVERHGRIVFPIAIDGHAPSAGTGYSAHEPRSMLLNEKEKKKAKP